MHARQDVRLLFNVPHIFWNNKFLTIHNELQFQHFCDIGFGRCASKTNKWCINHDHIFSINYNLSD